MILYGGRRGFVLPTEKQPMSLQLHLQSSHEALKDVLSELRAAMAVAEELEEDGASVVVPSGELDRIISQCQAMQRKLDQWQARL